MNRLATSYYYEMKKLLIYRRGWLFLVGILLLQFGTAFFAKPSQYDVFDRKLYASYTETYGGVYSAETEKAILAEKQAEDSVMNQKDPIQVTSAEELSRQTEQKMLAAMKSAALAELHFCRREAAGCFSVLFGQRMFRNRCHEAVCASGSGISDILFAFENSDLPLCSRTGCGKTASLKQAPPHRCDAGELWRY